MHQEVLYHGSPFDLELILPQQAFCPTGLEENNLFGVYAYDNKERAIARAIINCDGILDVQVIQSENPPYAIIFGGEPIQDKIYIYTIPTGTFEEKGLVQYISVVPVIPISIEALNINGFIPKLVRYADFADMDRRYFGPD